MHGPACQGLSTAPITERNEERNEEKFTERTGLSERGDVLDVFSVGPWLSGKETVSSVGSRQDTSKPSDSPLHTDMVRKRHGRRVGLLLSGRAVPSLREVLDFT